MNWRPTDRRSLPASRITAVLLGVALLGLPSGCGPTDASAKTDARRGAERAVHTMDLARVTIPDAPVSGKVAGIPFELESVEYHDQTTTILLESKQDHTLFVFLFLEDGVLPDGRSVQIAQPREAYDQPHVHVHAPAADGGRDVEMYMNDYVLRLELGERRNGLIPGRLYMCLPDDARSYVAGTFELPIE